MRYQIDGDIQLSVTASTVYAGSGEDDSLYARSISNGALRWRVQGRGNYVDASPAVGP